MVGGRRQSATARVSISSRRSATHPVEGVRSTSSLRRQAPPLLGSLSTLLAARSPPQYGPGALPEGPGSPVVSGCPVLGRLDAASLADLPDPPAGSPDPPARSSDGSGRELPHPPPGRDPRAKKGPRWGSKNGPFFRPCGAQPRGGGGAPPTTLILLRNQRSAEPRTCAREPRARRGRRGRRREGREAGGSWALRGFRLGCAEPEDCRRCLSWCLRPGAGTLRVSSPRSTLRCPPPRILADGRGKAPRAPDDRAALDFSALPSSTSRRLLA